MSSPPILYESPSGHVVLLDIPSSISSPPGLRLCSSSPPGAQYALPEPKGNSLNQGSIESTEETRALVLEALDHIYKNYSGPFLLPRTTSKEPAIEDVDDISDIYSTPVFSMSGAWRALTVLHPAPQKRFYIPPNSSFLLSDFQTSIPAFTAISTHLRKFHLVLLDPPWPNKSAARNRTYTTLNRFDIQKLQCIPLSQTLTPPDHASGIRGGLVGIWITNKPKFRSFVLENLFPEWGVEFVSEWVWVKITSSGEPIFDLESRVRKSYEVLMFGRARIVEVFPRKTILAVPDVHSRKPCIKELIEQYLPREYNACEIFGRNLTEGWVTWGDEAIKYNWSGYWS
ncbi:MT-A70-domain-containing protein [Tuber magnatum]|uniref:MT-A70-domain-containing protein n=1 Tax=Tuber magnatum TaxID=42249 RepID=A0A317SSD0_9PEZI|nr:MT-A70-domain-containing protein [Tuber magnatum]